MYTNVNFSAPLGVLAFLGTGLTMALIVLIAVYAIVARRRALVRLATLALIVCGGLYLGLLLLLSLSSRDTVIARGGEKHFCEIDCHLAYSVVESRTAMTLGPAAAAVTARGLFTLVTIKSRFDETTVGANRGDSLLYPNSRELSIVDDQGRVYAPSAGGQRALETAGEAGTVLTTPLRPGESYTTTVAFDLPAEAHNPTLLVHEGEWVTHLIIGHENSPLHKKTRFQL